MEYELDGTAWPAMSEHLRGFLTTASSRLQADPRFLGLAAGGSFIRGRLDPQSDLDLVAVVDSAAHPSVVVQGREIAASLGPLLVAFTGEHVGEPRLWICLYGDPPFHIDLKFVACDDLAARVEDPVVLWDRTGAVREGLAASAAVYPLPDLQWIEDRFWVWVHYAADKISRGELFEAIDSLGFIRAQVLGPMIQLRARSRRPAGVRRIETESPESVAALAATVPAYHRASCRAALAATIELYRELRSAVATPSLAVRADAERATVGHARRGACP